MSKGKYVAYVSSYTQGDSHGIRIYDVDMKNGRFKEKDKSGDHKLFLPDHFP